MIDDGGTRGGHMSGDRCCDFCGRSASELARSGPAGSPAIDLDEDGLWVCRACRPGLVLPPVSVEPDDSGALRALVGKSAGAICYSLTLPYEPPFVSIIEAASKIAYDEDLYMSAWSFVTAWRDGTTVWRNEDGSELALVAPDGSMRVQRR